MSNNVLQQHLNLLHPSPAMSLPAGLDEQTILQKLHEITRELGPESTEDAAKARLQETYPALTGPHLLAFKRGEVIIIGGHVTSETIFTRFRNFTGDCDGKSPHCFPPCCRASLTFVTLAKHWGGSSGGWFRIDDESASGVVFNAQNTPPTPDRAGGLIIFFKRDQSTPSLGTVRPSNKLYCRLVLIKCFYSTLVSTRNIFSRDCQTNLYHR